jgi:phosphatidylglycerophosphatase A
VLGLGFLPKAPGTFGSIAGVFLGWGVLTISRLQASSPASGPIGISNLNLWSRFAWNDLAAIVVVSALGVWAASRVATILKSDDPQIVVIDEVAGQLITFLGLATPWTFSSNWQYLLLGLILFRVFDIWKPFPVRQAESLPGGWGIMADDWLAGVYAALLLGLARALGL